MTKSTLHKASVLSLDDQVMFNLILTQWPPDEMAAISQMIFSDAFSWMKSLLFD